MKKGKVENMDKIKVTIENKQKAVKVPTGVRLLIRRCCHAVLELEGFEGSAEVDVTLVDNDQIHRINLEQRGWICLRMCCPSRWARTESTT